MSKKPNLKTILYLLILTLFFTTPKKTLAKSFSLSINPPVIEIILKPNTSIVQAFSLQNQGETTELIPQIIPIKPLDQKGHTTLDPTNLTAEKLQEIIQQNTYSYPPLSFTLENADIELGKPFTLQAGKSAQLVLRIKSSPVSSPQDSYLALTLSPKPITRAQIGQLTHSLPTLTALILSTTTPEDQIPINLSLSNFDPPRLHDTSKPLLLEPTLENKTPNMIRPEAELNIKNLRGLTTKKIPLYPHLILGNSSRILQKSLNSAQGKKPTPLTYKPSILDLGPHTLTLTIKTQSGEVLIEESRSVFLFPIQAFIYIVVLAIMAITLIIHLKKEQSKTKNQTKEKANKKTDLDNSI